MTPRFSAYLSIFNDWDILPSALASIASRIEEIVVVDGGYRWMVPFLREIGVDPERSDPRVLDAVRSLGVPVKLVTGLWTNEIEKRIAGFKACTERYIYRIDADEILFFNDANLASFIASTGAVGQMEMPIYGPPGWIRAASATSAIEQQSLLFDRDQISPEAHLHYLWLLTGEDPLPPVNGPMPVPFQPPIAFNAHLTTWRTPATSVTRAMFYTLNFMRHYGVPWMPEGPFRGPVTDYSEFFKEINPKDFRDALATSDLVVGHASLGGSILRPTPLRAEADAQLVPLHTEFLEGVAEINRQTAADGRCFVRDTTSIFDLSTPDATEALAVRGAIRFLFSSNVQAATARLRYLLPREPWELSRDVQYQRSGQELTLLLPANGDEPEGHLRRILELQVWTASTEPVQRLRCIRPVAASRDVEVVVKQPSVQLPELDEKPNSSESATTSTPVVPPGAGAGLPSHAQLLRRAPERMLDYLVWLANAPEHLAMTDEQLSDEYWSRHPRIRFFRSTKPAANVLDIGAGWGGLAVFRNGRPNREDIRLYGIDFEFGELSRLYEGWRCVNLDKEMPDFGDIRFDAFLASHVVEHLEDLSLLIAYVARVSAVGAQLYFEWPSPHTMTLPRSAEFNSRTGANVAPINFFDDSSHRRTLTIDEMHAVLNLHGFRVVESGEIDLGEIALEKIARGRRLGGGWMLPGIWSVTGWASYVIAEHA